MSTIEKYVLMDRDGAVVDFEHDTLAEAKAAAGDEYAVIARRYVWAESEIVWSRAGIDSGWPTPLHDTTTLRDLYNEHIFIVDLPEGSGRWYAGAGIPPAHPTAALYGPHATAEDASVAYEEENPFDEWALETFGIDVRLEARQETER